MVRENPKLPAFMTSRYLLILFSYTVIIAPKIEIIMKTDTQYEREHTREGLLNNYDSLNIIVHGTEIR